MNDSKKVKLDDYTPTPSACGTCVSYAKTRSSNGEAFHWCFLFKKEITHDIIECNRYRDITALDLDTMVTMAYIIDPKELKKMKAGFAGPSNGIFKKLKELDSEEQDDLFSLNHQQKRYVKFTKLL